MNNITVFEEHELLSNWFVDEPLISIVCTSYNHELFIRDALNGFFGQITKYPFEVIIHDDASTDDTQEIIKEYVDKYPKIIKPILQLENQWMEKGISGTTKFAFPAARGKYIAWCEGDDYWTDPFKLQKQVDFLEANPDYVLCFHNADYLFQNGIKMLFSEKFNFLKLKNVFTRIDLFRERWFIPTASIVFRKNALIADFLKDVYSVDSTLYLVLSHFGRFYYIADSMSIYRLNSNGFGTVINKPEYRIHDLKKWIFLIEPYEKKFIYRQLLGNYKLLLVSNINNKKILPIIQNTIDIATLLVLYFYHCLSYYFYTKKIFF